MVNYVHLPHQASVSEEHVHISHISHLKTKHVPSIFTVCRRYGPLFLNSGSYDTCIIVSKAQSLVTSWHDALKLTGEDLKLAK